VWTGPRLDVSFRHRIGGLDLEIEFSLTRPWTVLFAPSGAGKSTVLRVIAGLERPHWGRIVSRVEAETEVLMDSDARVFVPAWRRQVRLVAQQAALLPHWNVARNVLYGIKPLDMMIVKPSDSAGFEMRLVREVLALCRVPELEAKMPSELSGGERQRVALAQCLAAQDGRALLLDEPFSALDAGLRDELMTDLKAWPIENKTPVLHVTHDVGEVFRSGAEVIRMEGGRVVAQGEASVVLADERERLLRQLETR
jgi:molybdate transport system ATP-binding protein